MSTSPKTLLLSLLVAGGCAEAVVPDSADRDVGGPGSEQIDSIELRIEPAQATVRVIDGATVEQPFAVYAIHPDGTREDVTDDASLQLADVRFGTLHHAVASFAGEGAGPTAVVASYGGHTATSKIAVYVKDTVIEDNMNDTVVDEFATATTRPSCTSEVVYPATGMIVPANLGALDVQWNDVEGSSVFALRLTNAYVDRTIYTRSPDQYAVKGSHWQLLETSRDHVTISVTGIVEGVVGSKCAAIPRTVKIADRAADGSMFYAQSQGATMGIVRHDLATQHTAAVASVAGAQCMGCHSMSRDGRKMAVTLDGANGRGAVVDLVRGETMTMGTGHEKWSSATFTPDGTRMLAVSDGALSLYDTETGAKLTTYETDRAITNPELSPNGLSLVSVEIDGGMDWDFSNASVVVREFSQDTGHIGPPRTIVAFDAATNVQSYYPSFSPDSKWVAVTRSAEGSYASRDASVWVYNVNGYTAPVQISGAGKMGSWARWMPTANKLRGEQVYFLSFTSTRAYGNQLAEGTQQVWIAPFFPHREVGSLTAPAYRFPFQPRDTDNHNAQWTVSAIVE